ncbi:MAG TPA: TolC family outer membrane protein [Thermohalobaculum sp.]|nr:TolC family outer membrane protein [Thermohalobaculum sp.]
MRFARDPGLRGCAAALVLALACPAGAAAGSLADALVAAYRNSPELAAARADVKILSERAVQARAQGRLRVEGNLSNEISLFERSRGSSAVAGGDRFDFAFPSSVSLGFTQPLYTGGQVENATEAAETRISAQEAALVATEQVLLLDAVTAFMNVRRDAELVDVARNNVGVLSQQLRAASERFEVGEITRTDVEQARARFAAAQSRLAAQTGALEVSRQVYLQVVGEPAGELVPPPPLPDLPGALDVAVAIALRGDPRIIAARLEREASGSDVRSAMGALLPQVSLQGALGSTDSDITDGSIRRLESVAVGLFVTIPIWSGGANYARVREAQAFAERASADITARMRAAAQRVGVAWANLEVARASIEAGELEVRAAELAFEGVNEEAKVGARTTIDVLDAEQEVLNARAGLVEARHDEYVAAYALLEAIGKLTVAHLGLDLDETPSVASYYETVRDRNFGYDKTDDTVWRFTLRP